MRRLTLAPITAALLAASSGAHAAPRYPYLVQFMVTRNYAPAQVRALEAQLRADPRVATVAFVSCARQITDLVKAKVLPLAVDCSDPLVTAHRIAQPYVCAIAKPSAYARAPAVRLYSYYYAHKPKAASAVVFSMPTGRHRYGTCEYY